MKEFKFEIVKKVQVLTLGERKSTKELNLIKWGERDTVYFDIRKWQGDEPGKGISLSIEEARELYEALGRELGV